MTYSSKTTCPDRVLPSTSGFFFSERRSKVFTLHTPHFTLHSSHSKLQTSHSTLHTSHFSSSTRSIWNLLDIAGTILQLQSTMEFHRQLIHQHHLQSHLHCGNDPTVANHNGILPTAHARKTVETPFTLRERSYSCKSQWNSIGNSSSSNTCSPMYSAGTILELQNTMELRSRSSQDELPKPTDSRRQSRKSWFLKPFLKRI